VSAFFGSIDKSAASFDTGTTLRIRTAWQRKM
jgi:hypothetical protein